MKNLEELKKQHEELGKLIKHLEENKGKRWKPKIDQTYWFIDMSRDVDWSYSEKDNIDQFRYNERNVFRTKEQAETVLVARQAIYDLVGDYEPDWDNHDEYKFFVFYDSYDGEFRNDYSSYRIDYGNIYFRDEATAEKSIPYFQVLLDNGAF